MPKPIDKLKALIEAPNTKKRFQAMHDLAVENGATCTTVSEAADFSSSDAYTLLSKALQKKIGKDSYPYIADVFDTFLVYSQGYGGDLYQCDYDVDESGTVTLGDPISVVRKVQYISANTPTQTQESQDVDIVDECVQLVENAIDLSEATRVVKLIAPGWGSSGYYSVDMLKRDGPSVFKSGTQNFIDHPTAIEEKERPEGSINRLGSVLVEDATWQDDYKGHGPGLYSKAKVTDEFSKFLDTFGQNIGMSIRASGKARAGESEGRKGLIIESITNAKSVDYVTVPGAGGKVLELFESYRNPNPIVEVKPIGVKPMAENDDKLTKLEETINGFNARYIRSEAREYVRRKLTNLKVKEAVKDRIIDSVIGRVPLNESSEIDNTKFDTIIAEATKSELEYLNQAGNLGKIEGFGSASKTDDSDVETLYTKYQEAITALDK